MLVREYKKIVDVRYLYHVYVASLDRMHHDRKPVLFGFLKKTPKLDVIA